MSINKITIPDLGPSWRTIEYLYGLINDCRLRITELEAKMTPSSGKKEKKIKKVMKEFGKGELHSGSKKGPEVTSRKQAVAIGLSEARKAGAKIPKKK